MLSNFPEATKVDEESDEFQNVVKQFYETIQEYHSKIRIIQVKRWALSFLQQLTVALVMTTIIFDLFAGWEAHEQAVVQSVQAEEGQRTAACHLPADRAHSVPRHEREQRQGDMRPWLQQKLLWKEWYAFHTGFLCLVYIGFCHIFWCSVFFHAATVYGQGVYFAVNSALSVQDQYSPPNADGYKFIFVSKVLTGDYTKGCHSMKTAPLKETGDIPLRYDSVTDNITKPSMFVIFNDTQAFPEYLITCQRIHRWGEWIRRRRWHLERADCWCFNVSAFSLKKQFWFIKG